MIIIMTRDELSGRGGGRRKKREENEQNNEVREGRDEGEG